MVDTTITTDTLSGTSATTERTKDGGSIEEESTIQNTHWLPELSSKSSQEWHTLEPSSGTSISDLTNSDSESETTIQLAKSNGSPSIPELKPLEPGQEETL